MPNQRLLVNNNIRKWGRLSKATQYRLCSREYNLFWLKKCLMCGTMQHYWKHCTWTTLIETPGCSDPQLERGAKGQQPKDHAEVTILVQVCKDNKLLEFHKALNL